MNRLTNNFSNVSYYKEDISKAKRGNPMISRSGSKISLVRPRYLKPVAASVAITIALMLVFVFSFSSDVAYAADGPKQVRGIVWDAVYNELEGADVIVTIRDPSIRATLSDITDANGYYSVTFGPSDWDIGNTIEVNATYDSNQETNSTSAIDSPSQWVNVTIAGFVIPEFGDIGMLIAVIGLLTMFMAVAWRRRSQQ